MFLKLLFIIPILAIINIILIPRLNEDKLKNTSLFWSIILIIYFSIILVMFNENKEFQFSLILNWFSNLDSVLNWGYLIFSIDGISLFFIGLSILLIPICIIMSWESIKHLKKEFLLCLYTIILLLIGVFTILDILGFYILFEAILIPMFLIIGIWGSREEKVKAAFYFFFYTLIGSLLMLISIFKIYSILGTTNYQNLLIIEIPSHLQFWLFLGFFASLSVKIPMIPVHIWLPQAHVEAPVAGSVLLAGILLKLGGYGFMRFSYTLFPIASEYFSPVIIIMSLIAIIYASFTTCRQTDIKRLIAYSSVSHMGLVTLAIFTHSYEGLIAALIMMIAHGLVSSGLFMCSAVLYVRHHSRTIKYLGVLTITMPIFSTITLILILANIGFPLTFNFIAEFFSILAAFNYSFIAGLISCVGTLLATVYALYFYNRVYFGAFSKYIIFSRELIQTEFQGFLPLILLTLILGIFPNFVFKFLLTSSFVNISL
uniref:NADH-ubiquinone oxidoreductase chain 4 n=1 Tax=Clava multicornis TaxID=498518 RepID=G9ISE0_CLAMU|nr:NADH dehydrogenase subunit 4 [Clava multicornis]AER54466.1 NADH dehydrogenase subunit 4 [Clava multicornis]